MSADHIFEDYLGDILVYAEKAQSSWMKLQHRMTQRRTSGFCLR